MQLPTSSALGGCTDFSPEELSLESEELLESDELELSLDDEDLESSEASRSAELSLWPSLSSSGLSLSSSLSELSPEGPGSVSSPAGGGSLPSMDGEPSPLGAGSLSLLELSLPELEEESEWFSSSSNMARCSPEMGIWSGRKKSVRQTNMYVEISDWKLTKITPARDEAHKIKATAVVAFRT